MANTAVFPEDPPRAAADPFEGTAYRLVRPLAQGGMGEIFLVEHRELRRAFVAKTLQNALASNPQLVDRFRVEAQSLGSLRHPNIVSVFAVGKTADARPFMVTEYLQGQTVAQALANGRVFSISEAIRYTRETLAALGAAHAIGIVHRDIKPENLFIHDDPYGPTRIKVLDFGLARIIPGISALAPPPLEVPTSTGVIFGTPHYVSPEAALGQHVDQRADLYSVGLVLYKMLARRGPFDDAPNRTAVLTAHLTQQPRPPSALAPIDIPPVLDAIVLKALAKDPTRRFQSADAFDAALHRLEADVVLEPSDRSDAGEGPGPGLRSTLAASEVTRAKLLGALILFCAALFTALMVFGIGRVVITNHGAP